ncbi:MAG TPA: hypothetical protein VF306_04280 [Pirellulales bacterium]
MTRIIVNEALRGLLPDLTHPLVLCDETGRLIGHFLPAENRAAANGPERRGEPQLSEEELQRIEEEEPYCSTAELLAYLERLP